MTQVLSNFIRALRAADVRVSTAESIDAAAAVELVGFSERGLLKQALSQVLAKTPDDKARFDACFDRYFSHEESAATRGEPGEGAPEEGAEARTDEATGAPPGAPGTGGEQGGGELLGVLERGDTAALEQMMAAAARNVQLENIRLFTQRGMYMRRILEEIGIDEFDERLFELARETDEPTPELLRMRELKARLTEDVSALVDREMLMYTANAWPSLREEILQKTPLARIEARDFRAMQQLVEKLAKRLIALHSRRRRVARRGQLDVRHTIRRNIEYDGLLFDTVWKRVRVDRPKVIAVCDVSGSVAQVARFLLLFLYSVTEVIPRVRAFAFSNELAEVTDLFEREPVERAVAETIERHGYGSTDYGGALAELERVTAGDLDHRTTVLILGDARSNYADPGHRALRRMHARAKRVLWLNPEPRAFWDTGDSEMHRLGVCCDRVEPCRSLRHLERIVSEIARTAV